jgi:hypothetical protein
VSTYTESSIQRETLGGALDRVFASLTETPASTGRSNGRSILAAEDRHPFEQLRAGFGLSQFEHDVLVMCAGFELESRFSSEAGGAAYPTFGLALTTLAQPHWSAIAPSGPLRYWQLLDVGRGNLLDAPLQLEERTLQFVLGVPALDERLQPLVRPLSLAGMTGPERAEAVAMGVSHWDRIQSPGVPLLLIGAHRSTRQSAFVRICRELGLQPYALDASALPNDPGEREQLARLWTREALLSGPALLVGTDGCERASELAAWVAAIDAPVAIEVRPGSAAEQLDGVRLQLAPLSSGERRELWHRSLGPLAELLGSELDRIAEYFAFDESAIQISATSVLNAAASGVGDDPGALCWQICREHGRRSLETLAQRIVTRARWDDLVLPEAQVQTLREIAVHVRRRTVVNDQWGFGAKHSRGLGMTAMFAGASGTGKSMAAEVLAAEFELDLYRVDLAAVVSKYIGETEKNLRAVFDGAEQSGAVLLFDEADALFGKRSEVRDSHDRYANLEISYLLQRMETYRGVAILTTNMQHALDPAFVRRIRFIVHFPFPDPEARVSIWRRIFPAATPVADLDFDVLAQLNVPGGVISNIAMHAAFLAADDSGVVERAHILAAARTEYAKLEKELTAAEIRGLA